MGEIMAKFEERGFRMAAMKFIQASKDLLANHYADLSKKPFFPELLRYMQSGPIVAMVWTGLNIVPSVRAMVGATRPMDAAPGSIRGDLCVDVGRNLIHASDSSEAAAKEVAMWFSQEEIVQWRPCSLEWTYEDEVPEESEVIEQLEIDLRKPTNYETFIGFHFLLLGFFVTFKINDSLAKYFSSGKLALKFFFSPFSWCRAHPAPRWQPRSPRPDNTLKTHSSV